MKVTLQRLLKKESLPACLDDKNNNNNKNNSRMESFISTNNKLAVSAKMLNKKKEAFKGEFIMNDGGGF